MTSVHEHVAAGRSRLVEAGFDPHDAALDARVLARSALGWSDDVYVVHGRGPAPSAFVSRFTAMLTRRVRREPVSIITGRREFWGLEFEVTPDVLTPRPETETLLDTAVALIRANRFPTRDVVDVGTGSGCVAVACARTVPWLHVTATDLSSAALAVARRNAARHGVGARIHFVRTSLLDGLRPAGLVIANLPYIPSQDIDSLPADVRDYEPRLALDGGPHGLGPITRLLDAARHGIAPGGYIGIEIGAGQARAVERHIAERSWLHLEALRRDLQGVARVAVIRRLPLHGRTTPDPGLAPDDQRRGTHDS